MYVKIFELELKNISNMEFTKRVSKTLAPKSKNDFKNVNIDLLIKNNFSRIDTIKNKKVCYFYLNNNTDYKMYLSSVLASKYKNVNLLLYKFKNINKNFCFGLEYEQ